MSTESLRDHWQIIWRQLGAQVSPDVFWDQLRECYRYPVRDYHTFDGHIADGFEELLRFSPNVPPELGFAWFCHDAIMNRDHTSEQFSAALATKFRQAAGMPEELGPLISAPILATRHHEIPTDFNSRVMVDVDLAILGKPTKMFDRYEEGIRNEYLDIKPRTFARERTKILQGFLNRDPIYLNRYFIDKYEAKARKNIERSLKRLKPFIYKEHQLL